MQKFNTRMMTAAALGMIAMGASADQANTFDLVITADNHYSVYTRTGSDFFYHGGNELGAGGNPGTYNWSLPETYSVAGDLLYLAAWSDDSVAQGLLAQVLMNGNDTLHSGDARWEVYSTGVNRGDGDPHPTTSEIAGYVSTADTNNLWDAPYIGGSNGIGPWGTIPGITSAAKWMWWSAGEGGDPLNGGSGAGEMLIFRTNVPTPGAAALAGMSALIGLRRRR